MLVSSVARLGCALAAACVLTGCWSAGPASSEPTTPVVDGTLSVAGLSAPVRIIRDRWGVAHITAETTPDLFFAQGFVQAEDRLFQMDLWRRAALGRLAEVLGANFIGRDAMTRRMQFEGDLEADWAASGPDAKMIATAFVTGVNAWIARARERLPEEFVVAGWRPEPWRPEDLLNRTDAFLASGDAIGDVFRARMVAALGAARASALLGQMRVPPALDPSLVSYAVADAIRSVGTRPFFAASNAWAVTGSRSATGQPLVANDPHGPLDNPSPLYLVHLKAPGWNVVGATPPWLPGVALGHNERVAWAMAARPVDTQDVYVERVNAANRHQIEERGRAVNTRVVIDRVRVKGRARPVEFDREYTPHGIGIATDPERHLGFVLRWSGMEAGAAAGLGALAIDRAQSADAFRQALRWWHMPAVDVIYADRDGVVGSQAAALLPRRSGADGRLPVPGWNESNNWDTWQTLDELAHESNPRDGVVLAANNDRARVTRLEELLSAPVAQTTESFMQMQQDVVASNASRLIPLLAAIRIERDDVARAREDLVRWDRRVTAGAPAANLYVSWERALKRKLAALRIDAALVDDFAARLDDLLLPAITSASPAWFDSRTARDRLLADSLAVAVDERKGPSDRVATFVHGLAVSESARRRFNVGPFRLGGYEHTVMTVDGPGDSIVRGASFRAVYDVADWDRSMVQNAPGQSGSPASPHFRDLAALWAEGRYFPLAFSDAAIQTHVESTLVLAPVAGR